MLILGIVVVTAPSGSIAQQTRPSSTRVTGSYELVFAGYFNGRGNGNANPKFVIITGQVADDAGASGNFQAKCTRNGNLFSGTASGPSGGTITIKGRLDPPSKALPKPRLSFTYIASNGNTGRGAGVRRGP
jgi:hypothetical protein